jgi:hypothetical protein
VLKDPQAWISLVELFLLFIFVSLGYMKYKELRAVKSGEKQTELFS